MRKLKKSQGTGSGSAEVYEPRWRFFKECMFLEEVITSNRPSITNMPVHLNGAVIDDASVETLFETGDEFSPPSLDSTTSEEKTEHPKRKRKVPWMEKAAAALSDIAKNVNECPTTAVRDDDEWDVFGRDVANTLRGIESKDLQRRVKFAIQTAIFQTIEQQQSMAYPIHCNNYSSRQDNNLTYHDLMPLNNK